MQVKPCACCGPRPWGNSPSQPAEHRARVLGHGLPWWQYAHGRRGATLKSPGGGRVPGAAARAGRWSRSNREVEAFVGRGLLAGTQVQRANRLFFKV